MARDKDAAQRLQQVARFADLSDKEIKKMADAGTFLTLPANWALMSENQPADKAYVLLAGEVAIRRRGATVATATAGDVIGEVGVLEERLRTAGVVSTTELEVIHFTKEDLSALVAQIPALDRALRATAAEHLAHGE